MPHLSRTADSVNGLEKGEVCVRQLNANATAPPVFGGYQLLRRGTENKHAGDDLEQCSGASLVYDSKCLRRKAYGFGLTLTENLQSDVAGVADRTDPNLVNSWGLALNTKANIFLGC